MKREMKLMHALTRKNTKEFETDQIGKNPGLMEDDDDSENEISAKSPRKKPIDVRKKITFNS